MDELRSVLDHRRRRLAKRLREEALRLASGLEEMGATKVILFGSTGRRERAALTSDLDIIAVMATDEPFIERTVSAYRRLRPLVAADILIYTPEEMETLAKTSEFVKKALAEGEVLHETASP
ncbi:MAG: nucleotidyltransferase domain-containing protein [Bacillota bacterium]